MLQKFYAILLWLMICHLAPAQPDYLNINVAPEVNPWSNLEINADSDQFQFIIVTDRTGGHRPGVFEQAVQKINLLQPEFVMSVGDLIEGYTEDTSILNAEWNEFSGFIDELQMPFFYVPGNHDLTNEVMGREYLKRFGRAYYHFRYKDVLFLCLNSEDQYRGAGRGTISKPQFDYIEETLNEHEDAKYTFVFLHQPLWIQDDPKYWPQVEALLSERSHTVFAGHYHHYVKRERNRGKYVMLATTGGGSRLRGEDFGEFDHVVWVTMTSVGPVVANLWLQGIWDENVATEASETFINALLSSRVVEIAPQFEVPADLDHTFQIKLTNPFDIPLSVRVEEGFGWDQWVTVDSHQIELAPNSVAWIDGSFHARRTGISLEKMRSTPVTFFVSAVLNDGNLLEIPIRVNLKPLQKTYLITTDKEPLIDGVLDEWDLPQDYITFADNKFRFSVTHDESYLFLAAEITDDTLVIDTSTSISRQDNIGLYLSFAPEIKSSRSPAQTFHLRLTPHRGEFMSQVASPKNIPDDWQYSCISTATGYSFEAAIPLKYAQEAQGGNWQSIRLNWNVDDLDDHLDWQKTERNSIDPLWGSDAEILGSGIYFKR
ncbi:MAG: hypothetical protein HKN76_12885 [Saprospiraceae bacterium]|nr:hypothetical protein [Saprospiraceae bacterium]